MSFEIRKDDPTSPHVAALLTQHLHELLDEGPEFSFALNATGLAASNVTFWTAWDGETLAGFGALKELTNDHGEVKSMRAAPEFRGRGVGHALLEFIIAEAEKRGYRRLSLETGTKDQYAPAVALYRRAGFVSCEPFADYRPSPHNQFFQLDLPRRAASS